MIYMFILSVFFGCGLFGNSTELDRLLDGNERFMNGNLIHPNRTLERRKETVYEQEPFAVIVSCSDSRVSPELIFDEGIGDLFVVRLAGNVIDSVANESIAYAIHHLHSSIILVMGHENCGAVNAVLENQDEGIPKIAALISPSTKKIRLKKPSDRLEAAIKANAVAMKNKLARDKNFKTLIEKEKLQIFPAYYHLKSGMVEIIE